MKRFSKYIMSLGLALATVSCNYTDLDPTDQIDDGMIFTSVDALEQTVIGSYGRMSVRQVLSISEVLSDDVIKGGQNGGAGDDTFQWTYTTAIGDHSALWSSLYQVMNEVNRILKGAEGVIPVDKAEEIRKNNSVGTATFLRAYNALELLMFFSDIEKGDSYGIPYTKEPIVFETPGRNTVSECFTYMLQDLETARPLLSQQEVDDPCYVSQVAVDALRARIYLYMHDYQNAYKYASDVLSAVPVSGKETYAAIWTDESNADIIWKLARKPGNETIGTIFWSADNSSAFEASEEFISSFDEGDIRKDIFTGKGPDREGVIVNRVNKYKGTSNVGLADGKMLRASEMKLIQIEAKARTSDGLSTANELLNEFRALRIAGWTNHNYSTSEILDEILLERRRELCFEGHRFFDMRRFGKDMVKNIINKTLEKGNHRWLLPIPLAELQANPVIAQQQNPGYSNQ